MKIGNDKYKEIMNTICELENNVKQDIKSMLNIENDIKFMIKVGMGESEKDRFNAYRTAFKIYKEINQKNCLAYNEINKLKEDMSTYQERTLISQLEISERIKHVEDVREDVILNWEKMLEIIKQYYKDSVAKKRAKNSKKSDKVLTSNN